MMNAERMLTTIITMCGCIFFLFPNSLLNSHFALPKVRNTLLLVELSHKMLLS